MYLADKTCTGITGTGNEKGFYNRLISGNVNQTIVVDSMVCDFDSYPYRVTTMADDHPGEQHHRTLPGGTLPPAEHGPFGQQPARVPCGAFEILENRDLRTVER